MTGTFGQILTERQWGTLRQQEDTLYRDEQGLHPYTSVVRRDESQTARVLWDEAERNVEAADFEGLTPMQVEYETAKRVAYAMSVLAGGVGYFNANDKEGQR